MTTMLDWTSELNLLLERLVDGDLTDEQRGMLNQLLSRGDEQRCYYRTYMKLHAALEWRLGKQQNVREVGYRTKTVSDEQSQPLPLIQSPPTPAPTFLSTAFPATIGYSSGWSVAYLTATVITGLWLLSMWLTPVSRAGCDALRAAGRRATACPRAAACIGGPDHRHGRLQIGRSGHDFHIRRLFGWERNIELASGLMEITYDTGAKVILQGPVTYSVEANGGYLAVGKLTGKLEKKWRVASGQWPVNQFKSQIPNL